MLEGVLILMIGFKATFKTAIKPEMHSQSDLTLEGDKLRNKKCLLCVLTKETQNPKLEIR